ncbi:MAG: GAF domain-containing protein [Ferruginibacter sp.]|nr:GAF domain-containing protein [Cytophagales bacterium]
MHSQLSSSSDNVYTNAVTGATPNPVITNPDAVDEEFIRAANQVLAHSVELIRNLVGAHQSAAAIVVQNDWQSIRKFFSLSEKYEAWKDYKTPAVGYGIHGWLLKNNQPIRLTQAELEAHSEWKAFGTENGKHPPMRGWMAAPIKDSQGTNWGLLQLSDKYDGEFTEADEKQFTRFAELVSITLEALWQVRNLQKAKTT